MDHHRVRIHHHPCPAPRFLQFPLFSHSHRSLIVVNIIVELVRTDLKSPTQTPFLTLHRARLPRVSRCTRRSANRAGWRVLSRLRRLLRHWRREERRDRNNALPHVFETMRRVATIYCRRRGIGGERGLRLRINGAVAPRNQVKFWEGKGSSAQLDQFVYRRPGERSEVRNLFFVRRRKAHISSTQIYRHHLYHLQFARSRNVRGIYTINSGRARSERLGVTEQE